MVSLILDDLTRDFNRPESLFDQHFGLGMFGDDLLRPRQSLVGPIRSAYLRPWRYHPTRKSGQYKIKDNGDMFKVVLDVQQFAPEELSVKIVDDYVVVEGKHDERQDEHGFISRQFRRRYKLPPESIPETVKSHLSSDGVLTITAPKKPLLSPPTKERVIPIRHTNSPALKLNSEKGDKTEK